MTMPTQAETMLAPDVNASDNRAPETLTATGASAASSVAMTPGAYATLMNSGDSEIAIRFGSSAPTAVVGDVPLAAGQRFDWMVETATQYVAVIARDGSSLATAMVYRSSAA